MANTLTISPHSEKMKGMYVRIATRSKKRCFPVLRSKTFKVTNGTSTQGILAENEVQGEGRAVDEMLKRVLSKGENIKERDLLDLQSLGFEVISDSNHYRLIYKGNEKYVITLHKTPSDARSGKNLVSDILKTISIYR